MDVFPPCGVNIGPGLMAAYYRGTPISKGLEKEREILNAFLNACVYGSNMKQGSGNPDAPDKN